MIRWCSYCQRLLGEVAPLTSFQITHGICDRCLGRLEAGEDLVGEYDAAIRLYRALYDAARQGDPRTCAELARRASLVGLGAAEVLVGLIAPALVEIGRRWEAGEVSVADEHRFTAWCEEMIRTVAVPPMPPGPLDLLVVHAPGNRHGVGARMAERVLVARGIRVETALDALTVSEIVALVRARGPRWVGISCALPHTVATAVAVAAELQAQGFEGKVLLAGQAFRGDSAGEWKLALPVCRTIDEAVDLLKPKP